MRHYLLATFTIPVALYCLAADVRGETDIPRQADISVSGIYLNNEESTVKILGKSPTTVEPANDFPIVQVCNSKSTEVLTLVFHYGDYRDSFGEFRVRSVPQQPSNCIFPPKRINHFVTGKGIRLGITKRELIKILGSDFIEEIEGYQVTVHYKIADLDKSQFLKKYNLPSYYGSYHFKQDKLVKFEFGFDYP